MAIIDYETLSNIIKTNPNKALITQARNYSAKLSLHVLGIGLKDAMQRNEYFENEDVFTVRNKHATSNKDLFERILNREQMVFTAKGGSVHYTGIDEKQIQKLNARLDKIRFNMSIRKWINEFALQAYRVDPMGVLFVEVDKNKISYPTYKSSECIFDYQPTGRKLEYVCFRLKPSEAKQLLLDAGLDVTAPELNTTIDGYTTTYFRFVDDATDRIVKSNGKEVLILDEIKIAFDELPGIRASDIIDFTCPANLLSPLDKTIELAGTFLEDRSIRDLSKKFSGFPKAFEPILTCSTCSGTGFVSGKSCPECTPMGADRGTGIKLRTKVADVARFPLPKEGQQGGIQDPSKFFGYSTPDISTWDKQDTSLNDIECAMNDTYWGTTDKQSTTGPTSENHAFKETATKTLNDLKPVYTRLNKTADWAETTENALSAYIGKQMFKSFQESSRTYGRYYILETPDELMEQYLDMKTKGAPQTQLFDILKRYNHALYQDDPIQLAIKVKLVDVEPFVHKTVEQVQASNPSRLAFFMKLLYSEWLATKDDTYLLVTKGELLIKDLTLYATKYMPAPEDLLTPPIVPSVSETIRAVA